MVLECHIGGVEVDNGLTVVPACRHLELERKKSGLSDRVTFFGQRDVTLKGSRITKNDFDGVPQEARP